MFDPPYKKSEPPPVVEPQTPEPTTSREFMAPRLTTVNLGADLLTLGPSWRVFCFFFQGS